MAEMPTDSPSRACRCLNVRIWPRLNAENPPDFLMATAADSDYSLTYVGEQGISIVGCAVTLPSFFSTDCLVFQAHPQVTMRMRRINPPVANSSRCTRFTTLTCLLCQTVAYRVQQLVSSDADLQEGPLLPTSDWVEQETLLSISGWVEVHRDCLVSGSAVSRLFPAHSLEHYQKYFVLSFVLLLSQYRWSALFADTACPWKADHCFSDVDCCRFSFPRTSRDCHPRLRTRLSLASLYLRTRPQRRHRRN